MDTKEVLASLRNQDLRDLYCFHGQLVLVDAKHFDSLNEYRWLWEPGIVKGGAYRAELDSPYNRKVWLHRQIMVVPEDGVAIEQDEDTCEIRVGFLNGDRAHCYESNLFLFRPGAGEGNKLRAAARARAGVFGGGTHNAPVGEGYETLGCTCGMLTRVPVDIQKSADHKCRCCKCKRRLSKDSL